MPLPPGNDAGYGSRVAPRRRHLGGRAGLRPRGIAGAAFDAAPSRPRPARPATGLPATTCSVAARLGILGAWVRFGGWRFGRLGLRTLPCLAIVHPSRVLAGRRSLPRLPSPEFPGVGFVPPCGLAPVGNRRCGRVARRRWPSPPRAYQPAVTPAGMPVRLAQIGLRPGQPFAERRGAQGRLDGPSDGRHGTDPRRGEVCPLHAS